MTLSPPSPLLSALEEALPLSFLSNRSKTKRSKKNRKATRMQRTSRVDDNQEKTALLGQG